MFSGMPLESDSEHFSAPPRAPGGLNCLAHAQYFLLRTVRVPVTNARGDSRNTPTLASGSGAVKSTWRTVSIFFLVVHTYIVLMRNSQAN